MKALVRACLFAFPLLAASATSSAQAWGPVHVDAGVNAHWNTYFGCAGGAFPRAMPWYSYWPYEAHFQTPAPVGGWPYWPTSAIAPAPVYRGAPRLPANESMHQGPRGIQPVGYFGAAPSYWYGR